jgi:hypothetical protein
MNVGKLIGLALVVLGVVVLTYAGITYKTQEKVVAIGDLKITQEKTRTVPPAIGLVGIAAGLLMVVFSGSRKGA